MLKKEMQRNFTAIIYFVSLFFGSNNLYAQCTDGSQPECNCETAELLCSVNELDGFSFSMDEFTHPGPAPCGPGTIANNPTWFSFVAWCEDIEMTVEIDNCSMPSFSIGVQVAVFENCTNFPIVDCVNDCGNENDKVLYLENLIIGEVYHFMIDGCGGSACDVEISVDGSCDEFIEDWTDTSITGNLLIVQEGVPELYTVEDLDGATSYHWSVDGTEIDVTSDPENTILWDTEGTFELCVDVSNECIVVTDEPMEICEIVQVSYSTLVFFSSSTYSETEGNIQSDICLSIMNEDPNNATNCDVTLSGTSTATNGIDYSSISTTQPIHFPAGSGADECFTVTIIDDNGIEPNETINFDITSISGGDNAIIDSPSSVVFTIIDNDDIDGDGISNVLDNCVANFNPGQEDIDNDGIGDVCDTANEVTQLFEIKDNIYVNNNYSGLIVKSSNGNCWILAVKDNGELDIIGVECP